MENVYVYFIFSSTPYRIGKLIRAMTNERYNHVSISLDSDFQQMYSFARKFYRTPLYGGFVRETTSRYRLETEAAQICVCRLPITQQQHDALTQKLSSMYENKEHYLYNHFSAVSALFHKRIHLKDAYTCVEFCSQILHELGCDIDPAAYNPISALHKSLQPYEIYTGAIPRTGGVDHQFFARFPIENPAAATIKSIVKLFTRI